MPALVNAHRLHACTLSTTRLWRRRHDPWKAGSVLSGAAIPSVDPSLSCKRDLAVAQRARGGVGAVMVHYTRTQGLTDLPTEVAEVARAARDVGVRTGFAVAMRNRNPLVYGASEPVLAALSPAGPRRSGRSATCGKRPMSVADQLALVDAVATAAAKPRCSTCQPRPAGRAMVHARTSGGGCGCLEAQRSPHPHASAGDQHAAGLARRQLPRGNCPFSRRHPDS